MATQDQREKWASLQGSAPQKGKGKPSPEEIESLKAYSNACKEFLSALPSDAVEELTGKKAAAVAAAAVQVSATEFSTKAQKNKRGQYFDYFLVIDFEATCNADQRDPKKALKPQEIIEFPVALLNSATLEVESTFHYFVKPVINPVLTAFCTELTGVTQDQVDAGLDLSDALFQLDRWLEHHCLDVATVPVERRRSFLFVSCGDWDLNHLRSQCKKQGVSAPPWACRVCNIKYMYEEALGTKQIGMTGMLEGLSLPHVGKHHCGIDDVRNITAILQKLIAAHGISVKPTPGSCCPQAFLGSSNAQLGLVPCDFTVQTRGLGSDMAQQVAAPATAATCSKKADANEYQRRNKLSVYDPCSAADSESSTWYQPPYKTVSGWSL